MLKIPKGLKKKKKGKKKGKEEELFTEEELEAYRQKQAGGGGAQDQQWASLAAGVDGVLRQTKEDLDHIKATSFFQREAPPKTKPQPPPPPKPLHNVTQITEADFGPRKTEVAETASALVSSEEEEEEDDIFDTSYVDAAARGEVRLAIVPDSPEQPDDGLFDTSHVDALISGATSRTQQAPGALDIGLAVGVLTGRIDQVSVAVPRRKRPVPGDLLLEESCPVPATPIAEPVERSILDADEDLPPASPVDLSVSLHTVLLQQSRRPSVEQPVPAPEPVEEEDDEFAQLATDTSREAAVEVVKVETIELEPVVQESWSVFEADKNESVFAEFIVEDQIDVDDPYLGEDDPFDTTFAEVVVKVAAVAPPPPRPAPPVRPPPPAAALVADEDDDFDFDPRAEETPRHNNRRKSSVRIHLTDPSGERESITSQEAEPKRPDFLGGSTTDLTQLVDAPLDPRELNEKDAEYDPFDTTIVDKIVAPGRVELKLLERELIGDQQAAPAPVPVFRVPSDDDFDPRAEEPLERRQSRPENLAFVKSVAFSAEETEPASRPPKPVTPYYPPPSTQREDLLQTVPDQISTKVLTPGAPAPVETEPVDPFDTSFAVPSTVPSKTELKLLAKEFSCEEPEPTPSDLLEPGGEDFFQARALSPEPLHTTPPEDIDPFDTSFAGELVPGRTELRLLESELLQ